MKIEKTSFSLPDIDIPAIRLSEPGNRSSALVMHGYGGNKEEQLGLCFRIAELGFDGFSIDLRGHGQNPRPFDMAILDDVNAMVGILSGIYGKVVTIGHSLGGRISLLSSARFRVGISPAASQAYSEQTRQFIRQMRQYRVKEETPDVNFELLQKLPLINSGFTEDDLVMYGARDVRDIIMTCEQLKSEFPENVRLISNALHSDIFLLEETFSALEMYLTGVRREKGEQ